MTSEIVQLPANMTRAVQVPAIETRSMASADVLDYSVRFAAPDDAGVFTGHAAVFNEVNAHNEIVKRGAFLRSIADHQTRDIRPPMLWSHDPVDIIGVWTGIREDATGLAVTGQLILDSTRGRDAHALLKARAVTGLSATGGLGTVTYSVSVGTLPASLTLNAAMGVISGTTSATGSHSFTITASFSGFGEDEAAYTLLVS